MRIVERPEIVPHVCAVIPGRASDPEGFIDTGNDMPAIDPHIYVSIAAVREMARLIGLPTADDHQKAVAERDELAGRVAELERECDQLQTALDASEVVAHYAARRGPKPTHKEAD